jgi:hypothetical protein
MVQTTSDCSEGDIDMILVIIIALLALFSLISFLLGTDEPRQDARKPLWDAKFLMWLSR